MKLKLNKGGLKLSAFYIAYFGLMMPHSFDPIFAGFAVWPGIYLRDMLHVGRGIDIAIGHAVGGWAIILMYFVISLLIMYCIGWALSAVAAFVRQRLPPADDEPPR